MKIARLIALTCIVVAVFAVSVAAQRAEAPAIRIVFINTDAFGAKDGITKYLKALDLAMGEPSFALHSMRLKMEALVNEIKAMEARHPSTSVEAETLVRQLRAKIDENQSLEIEIKRKQEDEMAHFERRKKEVLTPALNDIHRAIRDFATQKGYTVILDPAKLEGAILAYDAPNVDVTKEFIAFYNARPATGVRK